MNVNVSFDLSVFVKTFTFIVFSVFMAYLSFSGQLAFLIKSLSFSAGPWFISVMVFFSGKPKLSSCNVDVNHLHRLEIAEDLERSSEAQHNQRFSSLIPIFFLNILFLVRWKVSNPFPVPHNCLACSKECYSQDCQKLSSYCWKTELCSSTCDFYVYQ